ncbi:MAG: protein-tyrosine phosphatase-like protein [Benjaminiella poitrasii]|nr:MAG: protein-tyrosine phosphatase-like protein [Benjaminiella poitrasii]
MNNDKPTTITTNTTHRGRIAKRLSPAATITTLNQNPHITANSTLLAAKEAKSISPVELARRLQTNIPEPLLIDTRPLEVYEESRLRNSIHITVPTLLIKRYRRGVVSNFNLESFITTSEGIDLVIYDDQMTDKTSATWTLISVLQKNAMQVHWLQGGFDGFLAWDKERLHVIGSEFQEDPTLLMAVRGLNENGSSTVTPKTENEYDFVISEIIPHFLYLGPEIATSEQLNDLRDRSIRRILNMAEECDDDVPGLKENFIYRKIAAQDIVEMQNIQGTLKKAVCVIEDSKKHHEPIYVHCKAGKSRSAAAILAYLVLSEHWTLKRAYRHIVKARPNISPNIGFVAELMKLEEGVHGEVSDFAGIDWRLIDLANPPSPETQKEMGRIEKAWKRGKSMSDDLATVVKNQENDA